MLKELRGRKAGKEESIAVCIALLKCQKAGSESRLLVITTWNELLPPKQQWLPNLKCARHSSPCAEGRQVCSASCLPVTGMLSSSFSDPWFKGMNVPHGEEKWACGPVSLTVDHTGLETDSASQCRLVGIREGPVLDQPRCVCACVCEHNPNLESSWHS